MIAAAVRLVARPKRREEVLRRVREEMFGPTRSTPGCIKYRFYQDVENPNAFSFVEEWEDWKALNRHFSSEHVGRFLEAVGDRVSQPPEARFYEVVSTSSLKEAMERARASTRTRGEAPEQRETRFPGGSMDTRMKLLCAAMLFPIFGTCAPSPAGETAPAPVAAPASAATPARADVMPVTTRSEEARRLFEEGRMLQSNIRAEEARERYDQAIAADPNFALAYAYRASVSPPAERQRFLDQALAHAGHASEGERQMIEQYRAFHEGNPDRRLQMLEQLAQRYPADKHVVGDLAVQYYSRGEYDRAAQTLERALAAAPDFAPAYNMLGYAYKAQGDLARAERAFQNYVRTAPNEPNPYDSLGELYLKMGRFDEAREQFERAVQVNPRFFYSRQNIGNAYLLAGQYDAARQTYQRAMEHAESEEDRIDLQLRIAESYVHQGDYPRAKQALDRAEAMAREANLPVVQLRILDQRAMLHRELGELDEAARATAAIGEIAASADLPPATRQVWTLGRTLHQALIEAKRGNADAARRLADEFARGARERGGNIARYFPPLVYGSVALERRDYPEAIRQLEQADQTDPLNLYRLGLAHEAMGDIEKAREYFEKVANWNVVSDHRMEYAWVRSRAQQKLR